jgi:type IV secretory pathway VirD2 relaxase
MIRDDDFEPRLGKIRVRGSKHGRRYLQQILRSLARAGGRSRSGGSRRTAFTGSRIGRGAGAGRVLRDRYAAFRTRRVVIKTRIVKLGPRGTKAARLHLRYIQRDGVTREGQPGQLYDATQDRADARAFLERSDGDRHQFRFIVAAEDAVEYEDLKTFTRRLMHRMEDDLGTRLDWVAVDHYNTGYPHTHVVVRGKDETGRDLVIARDYIAHGMRERAAEIVTMDLGPRTDLEIETRLTQEVEQDRFTNLDRGLVREAGEGTIDLRGTPAGTHARFRQALRAGRLQRLQKQGLAAEVSPGVWKLSPDLEPTLRRMGERDDIIKTMHRAMTRAGGIRNAADYAIYDPVDPKTGRLVGRVIERGLADELNDRHYLIVNAVDGRTHYVDIGGADATEAVPDGAIVAIEPKRALLRPADRAIVEIAAANEGRYSVEIHLGYDPTATAAFAETHVRRLEAMRRLGAGVEREADGSWIISPDHLERAAAYERAQARASPVVIETLSTLPLDRQAAADGATWLDRELVASTPTSLRDAGFGRDVREGLARRRQWLIEQEFARQEQDRVVYRANLLGLLRRRELVRVAGQLSGELGLRYTESTSGDRIEGIYRRRLDLASGRFAVIEKSREFTLVPWRPILERNLGKTVSGVARGDAISWTVARRRGLGIS